MDHYFFTLEANSSKYFASTHLLHIDNRWILFLEKQTGDSFTGTSLDLALYLLYSGGEG